MSDFPETQPGAIIAKLREYNLWRRGSEQLAQPNPTEIGLCLDAVCDVSEKLERERAEARKSMMEAIVERERWKMLAEEKWAMRREIEELLGVESSSPSDEQFSNGIEALRQLIRERDEARKLANGAMLEADIIRGKLERERAEARRLLAAAKESLNAIHVEVGGWIAAIMKEGK
jgi:hypothetical protein